MNKIKFILISFWFFITLKFHAALFLIYMMSGVAQITPWQERPWTSNLISILGGVFIFYIGISVIFKKPFAMVACAIFLALGAISKIVSISILLENHYASDIIFRSVCILILYIVISLLCIWELSKEKHFFLFAGKQ